MRATVLDAEAYDFHCFSRLLRTADNVMEIPCAINAANRQLWHE